MSIDLLPVAICVGLARSVTNVLARLSTTYDHRGSYSLLPVGKFDALRVVPCETRPSFDRSMRRRLSIVQGEVAPMIRHCRRVVKDAMVPEVVTCSWQASGREERISSPIEEPHHQPELVGAISLNSTATTTVAVVSDAAVSTVVVDSMVIMSWSLI